jgi:hypothetical protein
MHRFTPAPPTPNSVSIRIHLSDDTFKTVEHPADAHATLMEALISSDISDVWDGGACGGACSVISPMADPIDDL